jgi:acetyl esterase/lipase
MNRLQALASIASSVTRRALRRVRHGPLRPGWTVGFELAHATLASALRAKDAASIRARRELLDSMALVGPSLRRVERTQVDAGGVPATWVTPKAGAEETVLLYFHGGGYVLGSARFYQEPTARLALAAGMRVLVPDYRLAPEHPYPAALEDALAVWRWLRSTGVQPSRVVVGGDSAGGGLTLALLMALRDAGQPLPAGALLLSPWVDLSCAAPSHVELAPYDYLDREEILAWARCYAGELALTDPRLSVLNASLGGLPPLFVQVGEVELLRDPVLALAERAREAGVSVTLDLCAELPHVPSSLGMLFAPAREAGERAGSAVRRMLRPASAAPPAAAAG